MILLTAGDYERMFGLDWQLLADSVLTLIAVFTLVLIMSYNLFEPAKKLLEGRTLKISNDLEEAKKNREEAEALKAEYEARLKAADKEVEGILSDARSRAIANEDKIVAEARVEAGRIMDRAKVEAELEKQKMADDVKKEMINVASVMAGKVVAASIDTQVSDQLIEETLKEMGDKTWQS